MCMTRLFVFIQLYDRCKKHLRNEKERERWMQIDYRYMTWMRTKLASTNCLGDLIVMLYVIIYI